MRNIGWVPRMSKGFHWKLPSQPLNRAEIPRLAISVTQLWAPTPGVLAPVTLAGSVKNREGRGEQAIWVSLSCESGGETCKRKTPLLFRAQPPPWFYAKTDPPKWNQCSHVTEEPHEHEPRSQTTDHFWPCQSALLFVANFVKLNLTSSNTVSAVPEVFCQSWSSQSHLWTNKYA